MRKVKSLHSILGIFIILLMLVVLIWAIFFKIPLPCIFRFITGFYCPTCGATRAIINIMHGRFLAAFRCNAFISLVFLPVTIWLMNISIRLICDNCFMVVFSRKRLGIILLLVGLFLVFGIIRNIPIKPFIWLNPLEY